MDEAPRSKSPGEASPGERTGPSEQPNRKARSGRRLRFLLGLVLLQLSLGAGLLVGPLLAERNVRLSPRRVDAQRRLVEWRREQGSRAEDLTSGQLAPPVTLRTPTGEPWPERSLLGRPSVLVFAGGAGGCTLRTLVGAWSAVGRDFPEARVVFILEDPAAIPQAACVGERPAVTFALDPEGELARRYRARWFPRVFRLSAAGRVSYVQPEETFEGEAPLLVRRHWQQDSSLRAAAD